MLKGRHTALVFSVFVHILLFAVILLSTKKQPQPKAEVIKPAIKSYLYRQPKVITKVQPKQPVVKAVEIVQTVEVKAKEVTPIKKVVEEKPKIAKAVTIDKTEVVQQKSEDSPKEIVPEKTKVSALPAPLPVRPAISTSSLSSHSSLARLRNSINKQLANDAFNEHNQVRSASVMHGEQIPVPHSEVELTVEEKHKQNTSGSHAELITKNDNGTCTIVREQILGSPVEASTSSFACGESKFDKSFREHMKKVNAKFVTYKK